MKVFTYFPTNLWSVDCTLDNDKLLHKIEEFVSKTESENGIETSNEGGYQGHEFKDQEFYDEVAKFVPVLNENDFQSFKIYSWVNVNKKGNSNRRHSHFTSDTLISGVYYVKVPKDSGRIRFYDPRPNINTAPDMKYYNDGNTYHWFTPIENTLIMFPAWLEHDVEPNQSQEERISISFNIFDVEWTSQV